MLSLPVTLCVLDIDVGSSLPQLELVFTNFEHLPRVNRRGTLAASNYRIPCVSSAFSIRISRLFLAYQFLLPISDLVCKRLLGIENSSSP